MKRFAANLARLHRAVGYTFKSEKVFQFQGKVIYATIVEHVPPDTTAALKILERLDPDTWKERTEVKHEGEFSLYAVVQRSLELRAEAAKQIEGEVAANGN
jgi:hypothetical protein